MDGRLTACARRSPLSYPWTMRGVAMVVVTCALALGCDGSEQPTVTSPPTDLPAGYPDPLVFADGRRVATKEEWIERRKEILELFREHVYGRAPGPPESLRFEVLEDESSAMDGKATLRRVAIKSTHAGREHSFELVRLAPATAAPSGVFLLLNNRPASNTDPTRAKKSPFWPAEQVIARGFAIAAIQTSELAPDDAATYAAGVIRLFEGDGAGPRPPDAWKAIGAWSWGAMRAMDYLVTDPRVDRAHVAVLGHSRAGKAALWAGAQDERFSVTISNESGCAGAALSRRPVGETVAGINLIFPHWFAENFRKYGGNEDTLPVDQHMLLAAIAPRGLAVGSAANDEWSDPEGEYLGLAYASSAFALFGGARIEPGGMPPVGGSIFVGPRGYHLRPGDHDLIELDWQRYMDAAERVWARP